MTESTYPGCRNSLRQAFSRRGVPETALDLMLASLSNNTIQQYNVSFKMWWEFCHNNESDFFSCSIPRVLCFLTEQYKKGAAYGSLNSHRSALSLLLGNNVGSDDCVKRLLKGVFRLKPSFPKYSSTWDPQIVLNHLSNWYPNRELSREKLTKKLVMLLALCTAQRVQTLSLIKLENISINSNGVNIAIRDILKTSAAGRQQPTLFLPYFLENARICPAKTLEDYLQITHADRPANIPNLLITVKRPYRSATAQSISRWIKQTLSESGVDVAAFSAHSTRHASTSAAAAAGVSIDTIRKAAGWTNTSKVFAKFYHRQLIDTNNFAQSILHHDDSA
ncbi:uncharacterized protein LOC114352323 isoform X2 [Ostrinia furnacalis]|uniref:uncharacterized protein LOC114352323 isoform X2 n=1 Tax=Ostrinia furnacalis TaxID=93504 RepID=UPI00103D9BE9|nr:uncharacterized protein LOC114352323 isoform X2 [Ostrinia furnacalis]